MSKVQNGIALALLTAVISGFANFVAKIGVTVSDPFIHTSLRVGIVALVLTAIVAKRYGLGVLGTYGKGDKIKLLFIGLLGGSIPFILFFVGLTQTSALSASLIHKSLYIWVAFLAIFFLKEKLSFTQMLGYTVVLWGNLLLFKGGDFKLGTGELMILGATLFWAVENVIAKLVLKRVPALVVAWVRMSIGAVVISLTTLVLGKGSMFIGLSQPQILTVIVGATTLFLYVLTWYAALSLAPATLVSALLVPATLITSILSGIFITQTIASDQLLSGGFVVLGVLFIIVFSRYISLPKLRLSHLFHKRLSL